MTKKRLIALAAAIIIIILVVVVILASGSCGLEKAIKADSPENLANLTKKAITENRFTDLQDMFTDATREKIDQKTFDALYKATTAKALFSDYVLMRMENGQLVLLYVTGPDDEGMYKLQDVRLIPTEQHDLFNH